MIIQNYLRDPCKYTVLALSGRGWLNWMSDAMYLRLMFRAIMKKKLDLKNPKGFNEKLQWLKLYDRKPEYTKMVDKYEVRSLIAETIGEEYLIPLVGGPWESFDEIDFDSLPEQFVLKCTHDSGGLVICRDKSKLDKEAAKRKIDFCMKRNYYWSCREWPYRDVKPRIIAEQYMEEAEGKSLTDYKFMCFDGNPECLFLCLNRGSQAGLNVDFYDMQWNRMPFERKYKASGMLMPKPSGFEKMVELSRKLSENIPFVRVDFYEIKGRVYFGELTFYPGSGMEEFRPEEWDRHLGEWIKLPTNKS